MVAKSSFTITALDNNIIVASFPKTGSTWVKALVASIMLRHDNDGGGGDGKDEDTDDPLRYNHPNDLVPSLEFQVCNQKNVNFDMPNTASNTTTRLFRTHIAYLQLPESIKSSGCRIVYITRAPKDLFVSMWHFINTKRSSEKDPFPFDEAFESFCNGVYAFGPFHEHVLEYWNESLKSPQKVLFLKYEDLKRDPRGEVKKLASFLEFLGDDNRSEFFGFNRKIYISLSKSIWFLTEIVVIGFNSDLGTCSIMIYFHGQDQSNYSSKQVNDRFVAEAAPLSPFARYSKLHTTELPIEFHEEEIRIRYMAYIMDTNEEERVKVFFVCLVWVTSSQRKRKNQKGSIYLQCTPYSERTSEEITISNIGPSKICKELDINCCTISG
ncbi:Cytosolic sulfotransferase 15 [Camellia lanceoleosa]|uniref:Cytosolic sulfotransferase 15 n=1 Tax=Camellia lanceoleosa TaxID=1840588 RepID=A0ACC0GJI3_9ERIC|nr:Cytosolic sulfotransferase 15 [Camellia lanceoleosa]